MTLKFVIRNILKRPFLNLIKVIGLSLSLSGALLIVLFLKNELEYDRYNKYSERTYRLTVTDESFIGGKHFARISNSSYIPAMADYFPEIESFVRMAPIRGGVMKYNEDFIPINQAFECDSTFFKVFDTDLLRGNPDNVLSGPGSMVVSESFAKRVFGSQNPEGHIMVLPEGQFYGKNIEFTVNGVMKDFPQNSHFHPEFIVSPVEKSVLEGWAWTYLLLNSSADPAKIVSGFRKFYATTVDSKTDGARIIPHLQKRTDIHLHSSKLREIEPNGNMSIIYAFSIAGLVLLFIAFANYTNLNIGMAGFTDRYLFVSKVCGASRLTLLKSFIYEGVIIIFCSVAIGGFISFLSNILIHNQYGLNLFAGSALFITSFVIIFSALGLLSGILLIINQGLNSIKTTSGYISRVSFRRIGISKSIIVMQYTISIALIVAVFVIGRQTGYALKESMGSQNGNLICMKDVHTSVQKEFKVFKEELLKYSSVKSVSAMFEPPGGEANDMFEFRMRGYVRDETNKADNYIGVFPCDYSFASIFSLNFLAGTNFSENNTDNDGSGEYIINETAMRRLHYTDPFEITGKEFKLVSNIEGIDLPDGKIIGVVQDFHLSSIKKAVEPLVVFKREELWLINFVISFNPGERSKAISDIRNTWEKMFPGYTFQYEYIESMYEDVYKSELLQAGLLLLFTIMALFICSMGMLGLTLLTTQRRTKEIGIRKINGAETIEVMLLLNMDILKWIFLSIIIALPLAFFLMHKWMDNFAYKTSLSWWIFAAAGFTAFIITFITISVQSWRAARRNPVEALRYE
ncbi:MAG TPA: ABC transporter permease [Bacteroidales bacterium]|nr:ABC transporter permease [Bacteroidales bacterium]